MTEKLEISDETLQVVCAAMETGLSLKSACKTLNPPINHKTLWGRMKAMGLPTKPAVLDQTDRLEALKKAVASRLVVTEDMIKVAMEDMEQGMALYHSCKERGVNTYTMFAALKRRGLPTKPKVWVRDTAAMSKRSKAMWANPDTRNKLTDSITVGCKKHGAKKSVRKARSKKAKEVWADPEKAARMLEGRSRPEVVAAISSAQKACWADPVKRAARIQATKDGIQAALARKMAEIEAAYKRKKEGQVG